MAVKSFITLAADRRWRSEGERGLFQRSGEEFSWLSDICTKRHLHEATFVQSDICMKRHLHEVTFAQSDICTKRHLREVTFARSDIWAKRHLRERHLRKVGLREWEREREKRERREREKDGSIGNLSWLNLTFGQGSTSLLPFPLT